MVGFASAITSASPPIIGQSMNISASSISAIGCRRLDIFSSSVISSSVRSVYWRQRARISSFSIAQSPLTMIISATFRIDRCFT